MGEAQSTDLQQLHCAVANALWPKLRKRRWEPYKFKEAISPIGNPRGYGYNTGSIPGPEPTVEVLINDPYIEATATSNETRLGYGIVIELTRANAHRALANLPAAHQAEYEEALDIPALKLQRAFVYRNKRYYRNETLTRKASQALLAVASAAKIRRLTPEQDDELRHDTTKATHDPERDAITVDT